MFTKKNYILFVVLLALAAVAYIYAVPFEDWRARQRSARADNFLSHVNMAVIDKVEVTRSEKIYTITKNNGLWYFQPGDWPTEQTLITSLEEKTANIAAGDLRVVSVNADNQPNFGITKDSPRVKLYQGENETASFIIGGVSSDYQSAYIGRDGDSNTYSAPETLVRAFDVESWQDRTITDAAVTGIDTVVLTYPGKAAIELTNKPAAAGGEASWRAEKPLTVSLQKEKVEEFLDQAASLEAAAIPDQIEVVPALTLELKGTGVNERLIIGGEHNDGNYLVKKEKTGRVYVISKASRDALFKQLRDFQ